MIPDDNMRRKAFDMLIRTEAHRDDIALYAPERLATAELALQDTATAYELLSRRRLTDRQSTRVASLLVRSNLLIQALGVPLQ